MDDEGSEAAEKSAEVVENTGNIEEFSDVILETDFVWDAEKGI